MVALFGPALMVSAAVLVAVCVGSAWLGRASGWIGRDDLWTVVVWPLPLVVLVAPVVAAGLWFLARTVGLAGSEGGLAAGLVYLVVSVVPLAWLTIVPPRWLFPAWVRARIVELPDPDSAPVAGVVPAVYAPRGRGHGGLSRWMWRIDGVAGFVWVDGLVMRFRAAAPDAGQWGSAEALDEELDKGAVEQLELDLRAGSEVGLRPPRGGWWTRRRLDLEVSEVDRLDWRSVRRWARDGLLTARVDERGSAWLWVADVGRLRAQLSEHEHG